MKKSWEADGLLQLSEEFGIFMMDLLMMSFRARRQTASIMITLLLLQLQHNHHNRPHHISKSNLDFNPKLDRPYFVSRSYQSSMSTKQAIHPLVRDLYKRALVVGKDYPHPRGLEYIREQWKKALRDPKSSAYIESIQDPIRKEKEMRKAVGKGRYAIREMVGVIQLKKYRAMRRRYNGGQLDVNGESERILNACNEMSHH